MSKSYQSGRLELWLAFGFGAIAIAALLIIAVFTTNHSPLLITVSKVTLALAAAGIAAVIPGLLNLDIEPSSLLKIRAGGALAVFVIVFFLVPAGLVKPGNTIGPPPEADYEVALANWHSLIDSGEYEKAFETASSSTKEAYKKDLWVSVWNDYLSPLGNLKNRKFVGAQSVTQLMSGEQGHFRIISFRSNYEFGPSQIEVIVLQSENDHWRVRDHTFYPERAIN